MEQILLAYGFPQRNYHNHNDVSIKNMKSKKFAHQMEIQTFIDIVAGVSAR